MRVCYKCKKEKSDDQFGKDNNRKDKISSYCKECKNELNKYYREKYKEKREEKRKVREIYNEEQHNNLLSEMSKFYENWNEDFRWYKYELSKEDYHNILVKQKGVCAICKNTNKSRRALSVDHCHTTGKVRGLLCTKCNTGLGYFDDNPERLIEAVLYLRKI